VPLLRYSKYAVFGIYDCHSVNKFMFGRISSMDSVLKEYFVDKVKEEIMRERPISRDSAHSGAPKCCLQLCAAGS